LQKTFYLFLLTYEDQANKLTWTGLEPATQMSTKDFMSLGG